MKMIAFQRSQPTCRFRSGAGSCSLLKNMIWFERNGLVVLQISISFGWNSCLEFWKQRSICWNNYFDFFENNAPSVENNVFRPKTWSSFLKTTILIFGNNSLNLKTHVLHIQNHKLNFKTIDFHFRNNKFKIQNNCFQCSIHDFNFQNWMMFIRKPWGPSLKRYHFHPYSCARCAHF